MTFGNQPLPQQLKSQSNSLDKIIKIQSILKISIGTGLFVLLMLIFAAMFPGSLASVFGWTLEPVHIFSLIVITAAVIAGSSYAIKVANQGNQRLAFAITVTFIYGSFYSSILISPIGFHDPGLYFVSAILILASLFVSEFTLKIHTAIIIGIFLVAFILERTGIKQTDWPIPTWHELITISIAFYLTQMLLTRTLFVLRNQSDLLNQQNEEILRYQNQLEDMVQARTSDLIQEKNRAIRANLAKSQFLANMSHELRTPLNAIIGYGELVVEGLDEEDHYDALGEKIGNDVGRIVLAGRNLLGLINHVLDFSKIEANQMTIQIEKIEIQRVVGEAVALITPLLGKTGNKIVVKNIDSSVYAYGDMQKLRQILINLLGNANKFTENGSIIVITALEADQVVISVVDTGIGMQPDFIRQLFQPFTQAENDFSRKFEGTGLGLAISKRFIELMNGRIEVESVFGQGTSFKLFLPKQSPINLIKSSQKAKVAI